MRHSIASTRSARPLTERADPAYAWHPLVSTPTLTPFALMVLSRPAAPSMGTVSLTLSSSTSSIILSSSESLLRISPSAAPSSMSLFSYLDMMLTTVSVGL